jgi:cytochrome P450
MTMLFDPANHADRNNPYAGYARLRKEAPVQWNETMNGWTLARYDDCFEALKDPRLVHEYLMRWEDEFSDLVVFQQIRRMLIVLEGPGHGRLRKLLMPSFNRVSLEALRPSIEANCARLLEGLKGRDEVELVSEFCYPLTVRTICSMLGVPEEDDDFCHERTTRHQRIHEPDVSKDELMEINRGEEELAAYFLDHIRDRRSRELDKADMISLLVHFEVDGDRLSDDEIVANIVLLYLGGEDTNANLLANSTIALLQHPEQAFEVRSEPDIMETAFDEFLRYDSSLQFHPRVVAAEGVEYGGQKMNVGDMVFCLLGSANRDEDQYESADELDLHRRGGKAIGFGGGAHRCLGAALARLQTSIALPALFKAFPDMRLPEEPIEYERLFLRGPTRLPLLLRPTEVAEPRS